MSAPAVERPSLPGLGTDPDAPAGEHEAPAGADREQELASAYGRGLAYHRWHRDDDALRLAGQMLLFAISPEDFVQDPEAEAWPS